MKLGKSLIRQIDDWFDRRQARKEKWYLWFAWYPVEVGPGDRRWLEYVERREIYDYGGGESWYDIYFRALDRTNFNLIKKQRKVTP
jgi:hypothetical protein